MAMRRKFHDMTASELAETLAEARTLSVHSEPARLRVAELGGEAARRLVARETDARAARRAALAAVGARAFAVLWWLHAALCVVLILAAVENVNQGRPPGAPAAIAALAAGGMIVIRWVLSGKWKFGPRI